MGKLVHRAGSIKRLYVQEVFLILYKGAVDWQQGMAAKASKVSLKTQTRPLYTREQYTYRDIKIRIKYERF